MGRWKTVTDLATSSSIISGATYGPGNEMLTISGSVSETRTYNSMRQLKQVYNGAINFSYGYPSTDNNGKIGSQTDNNSGEVVQYTYDAVNRLASATAGTSWNQIYSYDGFGNLTDESVTIGSAPAYSATPDATTNHLGSTDANGNYTSYIPGTYLYPAYDVMNRLVSVGSGNNIAYSYAPGNKRVWRGLWTSGTLTTDEVTFWSVTGQKLATYSLSMGTTNQTCYPNYWQMCFVSTVTASQTGTNYYFGRKLIKNASGYVGADRLGSIGKYYPYGQEKPSATTNGTEKFTGYFRDAETGLDYADQRFHNPGTGRFLTPDAYTGGGNPKDPGNWNRYSYAGGDPVNHKDPTGQDWCDADDWTEDCFIEAGPGVQGPDPDLGLYLAQLALATVAAEFGAAAAGTGTDIPDCEIQISYRPVYLYDKNGVQIPSTKNHIIISTIVNGVQTVYEGEPNPEPAIPNASCDIRISACTTNSLLVGTVSPGGQKGLGTPWETLIEPGVDCNLIAQANTKYNSHQLHYVDNGAPNSNSYAYTLLAAAGVLGDVGIPPPNTPGWGYNIITNPNGYQ
jgi:RHS repeat-associated protein